MDGSGLHGVDWDWWHVTVAYRLGVLSSWVTMSTRLRAACGSIADMHAVIVSIDTRLI